MPVTLLFFFGVSLSNYFPWFFQTTFLFHIPFFLFLRCIFLLFSSAVTSFSFFLFCTFVSFPSLLILQVLVSFLFSLLSLHLHFSFSSAFVSSSISPFIIFNPFLIFFPYFYLFLPFCYLIYPFVSLHSLSLYVSCIACSLISFASSPSSVPCCPYSLFLLSVPPSLPQLPVHWYIVLHGVCQHLDVTCPFTRATRSRYLRVTDCRQPGATYMRAHKESWFLHRTALPATADSSETGTQRCAFKSLSGF